MTRTAGSVDQSDPAVPKRVGDSSDADHGSAQVNLHVAAGGLLGRFRENIGQRVAIGCFHCVLLQKRCSAGPLRLVAGLSTANLVAASD